MKRDLFRCQCCCRR